jgi:hypothetical protein
VGGARDGEGVAVGLDGEGDDFAAPAELWRSCQYGLESVDGTWRAYT